jgi:hypothetical protein
MIRIHTDQTNANTEAWKKSIAKRAIEIGFGLLTRTSDGQN